MAPTLITCQNVLDVDVNMHDLKIFTDTLMFSCVKLAQVHKVNAVKQNCAVASQAAPAQSQSIVVCESALLPPAAGIETVKAMASSRQPERQKQSYWGILHWKLEAALIYNQSTGILTDILPDFRNEVLVQTAMSAAGVSLPMHGCAAVGHDSAGGMYTQWRFCEGVILTQPWMRHLISDTLAKHHDSSPHRRMAVGIICLSRPDCILSNMSLDQARWLSKHSKTVQGGLVQCFQAAVERGYVHLAADKPSNVALTMTPTGHFRVCLLHWSQCAERVRIKAHDQSEVMQYLLDIVHGTVDAALRQHQWTK